MLEKLGMAEQDLWVYEMRYRSSVGVLQQTWSVCSKSLGGLFTHMKETEMARRQVSEEQASGYGSCVPASLVPKWLCLLCPLSSTLTTPSRTTHHRPSTAPSRPCTTNRPRTGRSCQSWARPCPPSSKTVWQTRSSLRGRLGPTSGQGHSAWSTRRYYTNAKGFDGPTTTGTIYKKAY